MDEYEPQRLHPYAYANNNPTTFSDPDGLFWGAVKNGLQKAATSVASGVTSAAKSVVNNAGTIASVAGTVAMVAAVLPPPAQVVAAAAGAVPAVAGAIDTAKTCMSGSAADCAMGIAGMVPGVRQAKTAARGAGALSQAVQAGPGCRRRNSFMPGTKVLMADGSEKSIEDIAVDDQVKAADPDTGEEGARPVIALIAGNGDKRLAEVAVDGDGDGVADGSVTATDGHPWWVESERKWLTTAALKPGMALLTPHGARVTVMAVVAWSAIATVHNLTIDDIHTYYVVIAGVPVLVHNTDPGCLDAFGNYVGKHRADAEYVGRHRTPDNPGDELRKSIYVPRHSAERPAPQHRRLSLPQRAWDRTLPARNGFNKGWEQRDNFEKGPLNTGLKNLPPPWDTRLHLLGQVLAFLRGFRTGYREMRPPATGRHRYHPGME